MPEPGKAQPTLPVGPYIVKGHEVRVSAMQFSVGEDGGLKGNIELQVRLDMTTYWFLIALAHLATCEKGGRKLESAWPIGDQKRIQRLLEVEFTSGMQAAAAAAFAIDAFYASVKDYITVPAATQTAWRQGGTARHRIITQTLCRGFKMDNTAAKSLAAALEERFVFRDLTVHPSGKWQNSIRHPRLNVPMEWRFVTFRFERVKPLVGVALSIVGQIIRHPKRKNQALVEYCDRSRERIDALVSKWERRYGTLFVRKSDAPADPSRGTPPANKVPAKRSSRMKRPSPNRLARPARARRG
jgi:hypothetical protein